MHAPIPVARGLRGRGRGGLPPDRRCRHVRGGVRRPGQVRTGERPDPRHQLDPVRADVRRLHGRLVPRPRRVRLLQQRRRLGVHRPRRRQRQRRRADASQLVPAHAELPSGGDAEVAGYVVSAKETGGAGNGLTVEVAATRRRAARKARRSGSSSSAATRSSRASTTSSPGAAARTWRRSSTPTRT